MHDEDNGDKRGNTCHVNFPGQPDNLHAVRDTGLLQCRNHRRIRSRIFVTLMGGCMKFATKLHAELRGKLIVSCQALEGSAFRNPESIARFAQAAVAGGAAGIRANGPEDIRAIRQAVGVPIIGIWKAAAG